LVTNKSIEIWGKCQVFFLGGKYTARKMENGRKEKGKMEKRKKDKGKRKNIRTLEP